MWAQSPYSGSGGERPYQGPGHRPGGRAPTNQPRPWRTRPGSRPSSRPQLSADPGRKLARAQPTLAGCCPAPLTPATLTGASAVGLPRVLEGSRWQETCGADQIPHRPPRTRPLPFLSPLVAKAFPAPRPHWPLTGFPDGRRQVPGNEAVTISLSSNKGSHSFATLIPKRWRIKAEQSQ